MSDILDDNKRLRAELARIEAEKAAQASHISHLTAHRDELFAKLLEKSPSLLEGEGDFVILRAELAAVREALTEVRQLLAPIYICDVVNPDAAGGARLGAKIEVSLSGKTVRNVSDWAECLNELFRRRNCYRGFFFPGAEGLREK